ncbi:MULTISPECIES: DUF397 domain-containing protein [unclassified Nocardia]|uniref:DUF397 domain-containing protein n=1 Tax=unclassified Nocardia TaxID=2637762 RepID=UPI0036A36261
MAPVAGRLWRKSSYSGSNGGQCVEVCVTAQTVLIRDSKYTGPSESRPIVSVPGALWPEVLDVVLAGSSAAVGAELDIKVDADGAASLTDSRGRRLTFTAGEWDAFTKGVADGQFR